MFESYWYYSDKPGWCPGGNAEYFEFKSRFNEGLLAAMEGGQLTEVHLLALFVASQSSKSGVQIFKKDSAFYQQGMVRVLRFLDQSREPGYRPLQNQEPFFLSFTRRVMCRGDFSMPEYLVADQTIERLPDEEVQQVVGRLPFANGLRNMQFSSTPSPSPSPQFPHHPDVLHQWDYWNKTVCCLCHEFEEMSSLFEILVRQNPSDLGGKRYVMQELKKMCQKVDGMVNINNISAVFSVVSFHFMQNANGRNMRRLSR
jgi:hypothetical protein